MDPNCPSGWLDPRSETLKRVPAPPTRDVSKALDGVIIPVWEEDVFLSKACCASIRRFMGDIPITLLVDGYTDTSDVEKLHGVSRICLQDVSTPEYLNLCSGSSMSKLRLFWSSPYERFLCIDADAIMWGDLREYAEFDKYDFIAGFNRGTEFIMRTDQDADAAFDIPAVRKFDATLDWKGRGFANMGVFFARRGVFSESLLMGLGEKRCWRCSEQGLLNYLMWRSLQDGSPRIGGHALQVFPSDDSRVPEDRFVPPDWDKPSVIHWVGRKPKIGRNFAMSHEYRKLFLRMTGGAILPGAKLLLEDLKCYARRQMRSLQRRLTGRRKK